MILFRYILKNHSLPFFTASFVLIFVFLLNFIMRTADQLVGKGLSTWIIVKLVAYSLGWIIVLVIPMAVLVSTLMAFGSMGQKNEIAIMKASGISLYKMMIPPLLAGIILTFLLVSFNNNVYPETNHALKLLLRDISRKKPTLSVVPGVFSREIPRHAILARGSNPNNNTLLDLIIYQNNISNKSNVITAKKGHIYFQPDIKKLIMDLQDGEIHSFSRKNEKNYQKVIFKKHRLILKGDQFTFEQSNFGRRGDRELGASELLKLANGQKNDLLNEEESLTNVIDKSLIAQSVELENVKGNFLSKKSFFNKLKSNIRMDEAKISRRQKTIKRYLSSMNEYLVEYYKKYSIPFACMVFILIGAPLGTMIRKGGMGVAAGISLGFFLIYWAFLIGGEKLADRGLLSPFWGTWSANIFFVLIGTLLTIKSAKEQVTLDFSKLKKIIPKQLRDFNSINQNQE